MKKEGSAGKQLKEFMNKRLVVAPGAFNAELAKIIEKTGFKAVYGSGAGFANTGVGFPDGQGRPDDGSLTRDGVLKATEEIVKAVKIPVIVDVDTGFEDEPGGIAQTVKEFERIGAAAIQIEDQVPAFKRCGHVAGKKVIPIPKMLEKILTAVDARIDPDFLIIARTDARQIPAEGLEGVIQRSFLYHLAGADIIFTEALETKKEFAHIGERFGEFIHLLANMTEFGKTPYLTAHEFAELGYKIVIFPMTCFRLLAKKSEERFKKEGFKREIFEEMLNHKKIRCFIEDALMTIKDNGTQVGLLDHMMTRNELYEILNYKP